MSGRYARYSGLVDVETLQRLRVCVIGLGAVGRQIALTLGAMGVGRLDLFDPDKVEAPNLGTQGYGPDDVDYHKARSTARDVSLLNPEATVKGRVRACHQLPNGDVCFLAVDTMQARYQLLEEPADVGWLVDTRVGGEAGRVLAGSRDFLADTLYPDEEALGLPCNGRMIFYSAALAAQVAVYCAMRWARGEEEFMDIPLSLPDMALNGTKEPLYVD